MGIEKSARLTVGVDGADRAVADARKIKEAWGGIGPTAVSLGGAFAAVAYGAVRMATDVAKAATGVKAIDFNAATEGARRFDDAVTRMSLRGGSDVDTLKGRFREVGQQIAVMPERVAAVAREIGRVTYADIGSVAKDMRALGDEANDTDRSLEDMVALREGLFKLGVPIGQAAAGIAKIRDVAADLKTVGGHIALEDTLVRLAPQLARFSGGIERAAATVGVLGKGLPAHVAEQVTGGVMGMMGSFDPLLVTKKLQQMTGDRHYSPYERGEDGVLRYKKEVPGLLQRAFRRAPGGFNAAIRAAGGDINVAERFYNTDWGDVSYHEQGPARARAKAAGLVAEGAIDLRDVKGSDVSFAQRVYAESMGKGPAASRFSQTAAGARAETDVERAAVENEVGEMLQAQRDKRNASYKGRRHLQAAEETISSYVPGLDTAYTMASAASTATTPTPGQPQGRPITVDLTPQATRSIADAMKGTTLQVKPPKTPPPPQKQPPVQ